MNYTDRQLVEMANVQTLLIHTNVFGHQNGPPRWVECTVPRTSKHPAQRVTVVRRDGEECASLWARTVDAVRTLKLRFGFTEKVLIWCNVSAPPANHAEADRYFNRFEAQWHVATGHRTPMAQVRACGRVAKLMGLKRSQPRPCVPPGLH